MTDSNKLNRAEHLKHRGDFSKLLRRGKRANKKNFLIMTLPNELEHPRLGVILSRKVGNAVFRNRIRRLFKEAFRIEKGQSSPNIDIVIRFLKGYETEALENIKSYFREIFEKHHS